MASFHRARSKPSTRRCTPLRAHAGHLAQSRRSGRTSAPPHGGAAALARFFGEPHQGRNPRCRRIWQNDPRPGQGAGDCPGWTSYALPCYNRPLKDWLIQAIPELFNDDLVIDTYHGLVEDLCRKAGVAFHPNAGVGNTDFWKDVAPERLMQACERLGPASKVRLRRSRRGPGLSRSLVDQPRLRLPGSGAKGCYYASLTQTRTLYVETCLFPASRTGVRTPGELSEYRAYRRALRWAGKPAEQGTGRCSHGRHS